MESELTPEYVAALRRMSGARKVKAAFELYWSARKIKAARLRQMHPDWTAQQVEREVTAIFRHART